MCHGVPMDEVVGELIQRALDVAPGPDWTPEVQRIEIESMCMRTALSKPELEHLLTEKRRQQLDGLRQEGYKHFKVSFNRYGAYFRPDSKEPPTGEPPTGGIPVLSGSEFVRDFVPPDYLLDGILQTGFLYSFTARTGDGKTTFALLLAYCVAGATFFAGLDCESGAVFFLAGENPDDVRIRWIGLRYAMGATDKELDIHFIPGVSRTSKRRSKRKLPKLVATPSWSSSTPARRSFRATKKTATLSSVDTRVQCASTSYRCRVSLAWWSRRIRRRPRTSTIWCRAVVVHSWPRSMAT